MDIQQYLSDRITYLKTVEIDYFNKAHDKNEQQLLRQSYREFSNEFNARRSELEILQKSLMGENKAGGSDASTEHGNYTHVRESNAHGEGVESLMASVAKPLGKITDDGNKFYSCEKCGEHLFTADSTHMQCSNCNYRIKFMKSS